MGTWAYPDDEARIARFSDLMAKPIGADRLNDFYHILGDDTFFDMVGGLPPGEDVRPLAAMAVDEVANWSAETSHGDRLRVIVEPFKDAPLARLSAKPVSDGRPESAVVAVIQVVDPDASADRFEAEPGLAPGTHAVRDLETGKVYRFEHVYGVIFEAPRGSHAESAFAKAPTFRP